MPNVIQKNPILASSGEEDLRYNESWLPWHSQILVVTTLIFFLEVGLCWRLMAISFYLTYCYFIYIYGLFCQPRWSHTLKATVHSVVFGLLVSWCIASTPLHTPYAVHPIFRNTEIIYTAGHSTLVDIIAIHGLGSNPDSAWTYRMDNGSDIFWLRDLLPTFEGFQNIRVAKVNHQTRWDSNAADMRLQEHASELLDHIHSLHRANPKRPIIFIAHSFGGILLKKALLLAKARSKDVATMTRGIIFLGVPHQGSNAAFLASCLSCLAYFRGSSSTMLELMSVDGTELLDLESEFYDAYVTQYHFGDIQPYIYDIIEKRPEKIGKFVLGWIVKPKPGHLRHGRLLTFDTDHRGLNKFRSHDDPNFDLFMRVFGQAYDYALQTSAFPSLRDRFPPPIPSNDKPTSSPDIAGNITIPHFLEMAVIDTSGSKIGVFGTFCLYGLQELIASFGSGDRNRSGSYLTLRVPMLAAFGALIHSPLCDVMKLALSRIFYGSTSTFSKGIQVLIAIIMVSSLLPCLP
ncbi:hypothetical protein F5Y00DRAFT_273920 [Daldinia vernicosa]|uniref:uncharacterized protein n=1 Tax=Daldinia vernicosa TaxID=114800 RepID=UPI00200792A0|nr:uncharacterized protein F5Y00DRAFT_273920 [Daldinia vernicosa]KAI0844594.1 hypothetical protein F5Y00DRAFT_273920 [Daldinia vernicosa]